MAILKGFPPSNMIPVVDFWFPDNMPVSEQKRIRDRWWASYWKDRKNHRKIKKYIMEIHGSDIILEGKPPTKEAIMEVMRGLWPLSIVEDDVEGDFFVYRDQQAKDSWDGKGWTDDNDADMVYFLPREDQMTMVIDDNRILMYMVDAIKAIM